MCRIFVCKVVLLGIPTWDHIFIYMDILYITVYSKCVRNIKLVDAEILGPFFND